MKRLLLFLLLATPLAWANDASEWQPVDQVLAELETTSDPATFSYLIGRCTGLFLAVAKSSQSRASSAEIGQQYMDVASRLMNIFSLTNLQIKGLKPTDENMKLQRPSDTKAITDFANGYMDRINDNYTSSGHHIAKDPFMRQELTVCKPVAETFLK